MSSSSPNSCLCSLQYHQVEYTSHGLYGIQCQHSTQQKDTIDFHPHLDTNCNLLYLPYRILPHPPSHSHPHSHSPPDTHSHPHSHSPPHTPHSHLHSPHVRGHHVQHGHHSLLGLWLG